ncbi:hypothetical protein BC832DRAFT_385664 [Gaertneriomyces semiglobifer]|nr:hypothetical protein BC832DRAFT_385664 [Gaertneriomyces semiglobifer]
MVQEQKDKGKKAVDERPQGLREPAPRQAPASFASDLASLIPDKASSSSGVGAFAPPTAYLDSATVTHPTQLDAEYGGSGIPDVLGLGPRSRDIGRTEMWEDSLLFTQPVQTLSPNGTIGSTGQELVFNPEHYTAQSFRLGHLAVDVGNAEQRDAEDVLAFLQSSDYTNSVHSLAPPLRNPLIREVVSIPSSASTSLRASWNNGQEAIEYLRTRRYTDDVWGSGGAVEEFYAAVDALQALEASDQAESQKRVETEDRVKTAVERLRMLMSHVQNS